MTWCVFEDALKKDVSLQSHVLKQNHQPQSGTHLLTGEGEGPSELRASGGGSAAPTAVQPASSESNCARRGGGKLNIASPGRNIACNDILKTYS